LLREAAFDVCVAHPTTVRESAGWNQLKESPTLLAELFGASLSPSSESNLDTMKVSTLRQKLDDLDVDGTRGMLSRKQRNRKVIETPKGYCLPRNMNSIYTNAVSYIKKSAH
jgi:hypothetical protein